MNNPAVWQGIALVLALAIFVQVLIARRRRRQYRASLKKLAAESTLAMLRLITLCDKRLCAAEKRHADHDMMSFFIEGPPLDTYSDLARHLRRRAEHWQREANPEECIDIRRSPLARFDTDELMAGLASGGAARGAEAPSEAPLGPEPGAHERAPHVTLNEMAQGFEEHPEGDAGPVRTRGKCGWMTDPGPPRSEADAPPAANPEGPASYHESPYRR